ncbi:MAG: hydrophobe/amphiphile efflux-3 (HAE3) family transporter, partial [Methanosarcinales archaeon]|nr:hydrophobe/amphiphile efflux-3 (HAE3) family transporter [Methanosarcinales archaeon]
FILHGLSTNAIQHPKTVISILAVAVFISLFFISQVQMVTSSETFFPEDSVVYNDFKAYQKDFGTDTVFVMVKSEDVLEPYVFDYLARLERQLQGLDYVISTSSAAGRVTEKEASSQEALQAAYDSGILEGVIPRRDTALIIVQVPELEQPGAIAVDMEKAIDFVDRPPGVAVDASGGPMLDYQLGMIMGMSMGMMFGVALILMITILYIFFRTIVRGRYLPFLPLMAVTIALAMAFGLMGVLEIPMSMILTGFLSVLIGLGIDYGIQVMTRYEEERSKGLDVDEAIEVSITRMGKAVGLAIVTTLVGFSSMYFANIPDLEYFGMAASIGLVLSYITAIWFIPAVLKLVDKGSSGYQEPAPGILDRILEHTTRNSTRHPIFIVLLVIGVTFSSAAMYPKVDTLTDFYQYFPQDIQAIRFMEEMRDLTGGTDTISLVIRSDDITSRKTLQEMLTLSDYLQAHEPAVIQTSSLASILSDDGSLPENQDIPHLIDEMDPAKRRKLVNYPYATLGVIDLTIEHLDGKRLDDTLNNIRSSIEFVQPDMDITITGEPLLNNEIGHTMTDGQIRMTLLSFVFVFLAMFLIFKSVVRAIIPMAPIIVVIAISGALMWILGIPQTTLSISTNSIILGLGVDYSIHIMHRYKEERENGAEPRDAIRTTISRIGKAIVTSGLTTAGGFAAMMLSPFPLMVWFGIIAFSSILMILLLTLTLLPALLILLDRPGANYMNYKISSSDNIL